MGHERRKKKEFFKCGNVFFVINNCCNGVAAYSAEKDV